MERGVIVGGLLISASFMLAVLINQAANKPSTVEVPSQPLVQPEPLAKEKTGASPGKADDRCRDSFERERDAALDASSARATASSSNCRADAGARSSAMYDD
jgi:hypothetical protein